MTKPLLKITCAALLLCQPAYAETFLQKILRITGVSATPSQQKAAGDEVEAPGEIWLADITAGPARKLSDGSGYRSPIFTPDNHAVLAAKGDTVWRIPMDGGAPRKLHEVNGLMKLVGFDSSDPDKMLALIERDQTPQAALLSIATGKTTAIPHDNKSPEDRKLLSHLKGWERVYGGAKLYVQSKTREGRAGTVEVNEIFFKKGDAAPVNVSRSEGASSVQPSLSPDGKSVVFIRIKE